MAETKKEGHKEKKRKELEEQKPEKGRMNKNLKNFLLVIGAIIVFFLLFVAAYYIAKGFANKGYTIDELHEKNLKGDHGKTNYIYNGYSFVNASGFWHTQILVKSNETHNYLVNIALHYSPRELEDVHVLGSGDFLYSNSTYITFDPAEGSRPEFAYITIANTELSLNLYRGLGIFPIIGCTKNITAACSDRPIISCADNSKDPIIYFKYKDEGEPALIFDENCITVEGKDMDLLKAADKLLLILYKIIPTN